MKKSLIVLSLSLVAFMSGCKQERESSDDSSKKMSLEEKKEIVDETIEKLNTALIGRDSSSLVAICAEGLSYGHSSGRIQSKTEFIDDVLNGSFRYLTIKGRDQKISISEDVAIVREILHAKGMNRGDSVDIRIGNSQLYRITEDGACFLIFRQAYKL